MSQLDTPAMPVPGLSNLPNGDFIHPESGMTTRQLAAVTLRVPMSGDPELDTMIREARRLDAAEKVLQGIVSVLHKGIRPTDIKHLATDALNISGALLAASEPKKTDPEKRGNYYGFVEPKKAESDDTFNRVAQFINGAPQPDAEGWIKYSGDKCPVSPDANVRIKTQGGAEISTPTPAKLLHWDRAGLGSDIIAYCVVADEGGNT